MARPKPITIPCPLESMRGKPLKWAVRTGEKKHLMALFVLEAHARRFAATGHRIVEEVK